MMMMINVADGLVQSSLVPRYKAIGEPELQMILSKLARVTSASLGQPLEAKKRPDRWPVVWHMNDPASVKLYEGEEASTEDDRDAGHDVGQIDVHPLSSNLAHVAARCAHRCDTSRVSMER